MLESPASTARNSQSPQWIAFFFIRLLLLHSKIFPSLNDLHSTEQNNLISKLSTLMKEREYRPGKYLWNVKDFYQ